MKKYLAIMSILSLLVVSSSFSTQVFAASDERGIISVNTSANTEFAPDVAEISFAVQTSDIKSMQKATLLNKEISDKVFLQLKSMIDTQNGDYIKTSDFSANPVYSYLNSKKNFEKYEVSNRVIVHTKSIDKVGKMIDSAIEAGATNVDNLSFSLSNYEAQCNDLIRIATQKAKTRAEVIAQTLGNSLNGISNISTSCSTNNYNPPRLYMAKNMIADVASGSASSDSTSISNGVVKVTANINASFFVK
jgi:uncharacterized protein YggE